MSETVEAKRTYTSRWKPNRSKEPVLTMRHIEAFKLLTRYTYLPMPYFRAFLGGGISSWQQTLRNLTAARYLHRPDQQRQHYNALYRPLVYQLGTRGLNALKERGIECEKPLAHVNFGHELMASELMASFELGARKADVRLISWPDILKSQSLPNKTRNSAKPHHIPVTIAVDGERRDTHIVADGEPFGIRREVGGKAHYFFCPGVEADCGTEPVDTHDFERSSIYKKFVLYQTVIEQDIYRSHFGFPNLYIPIVTATNVRKASMMALLEKMTKGKGSKHILFKTFPSFTSFERPRPPSGHMLTEDWERVGVPSFNFLSS